MSIVIEEKIVVSGNDMQLEVGVMRVCHARVCEGIVRGCVMRGCCEGVGYL